MEPSDPLELASISALLKKALTKLDGMEEWTSASQPTPERVFFGADELLFRVTTHVAATRLTR